MRLLVDDEIYNVNAVWLGPPRKTLPWRARYVAYAVVAVVFVVLQMVERRLGIGMEFFTLAYSLLATIALTRLILSAVDHDRPIGAVVAGLASATVSTTSARATSPAPVRRTARAARPAAVDVSPARARAAPAPNAAPSARGMRATSAWKPRPVIRAMTP